MKELKAWIIVNKDFQKLVVAYPHLYSGEIYFTPAQAREHLEKLQPKSCGECGRKVKKTELQVKILPVIFKI